MSSRAYEFGVVALEELARLGIELQLLALLVQRIDAREQRRVEMNRIVVCRQLRREVGLDLQNRVIAVGIGQTEESHADPSEHAADSLHRDDGVVEARRLRVVSDGGSF